MGSLGYNIILISHSSPTSSEYIYPDEILYASSLTQGETTYDDIDNFREGWYKKVNGLHTWWLLFLFKVGSDT